MLSYWVAFTTCLTLQHYIALECVQSILKILPMPVKEFFYVYHCFIHLYTFYTNISQPNKNNILSYLTFFFVYFYDNCFCHICFCLSACRSDWMFYSSARLQPVCPLSIFLYYSPLSYSDEFAIAQMKF